MELLAGGVGVNIFSKGGYFLLSTMCKYLAICRVEKGYNSLKKYTDSRRAVSFCQVSYMVTLRCILFYVRTIIGRVSF